MGTGGAPSWTSWDLFHLYHRKGTTDATFIGAQSVFQPGKYFDPDAEANSNLTARLYYLFPVCRFAHYLKVMVRDKIGSFKERSDMESWLNNWISNYVLLNPDAGEEAKAQKPLAAAEVKVQEIPGKSRVITPPNFGAAPLSIGGIERFAALTSKLPSAKAVGLSDPGDFPLPVRKRKKSLTNDARTSIQI